MRSPPCSTSRASTAASNVAKLVAFTLVGFGFLQLFEALSWVVLVAAVIPWVDIASVYRGPTRVVVEEEPGLFEKIAIAFALPGEDAAARLGPPDVLFFALFLAAGADSSLRVAATWIGMTGGLALTLVATYAFELNGLPGLPAIALGFLVPNADLLWRSLRARASPEARGPGGAAPPSSPRDQQFACAQASMFLLACWTSAESSDVAAS